MNNISKLISPSSGRNRITLLAAVAVSAILFVGCNDSTQSSSGEAAPDTSSQLDQQTAPSTTARDEQVSPDTAEATTTAPPTTAATSAGSGIGSESGEQIRSGTRTPKIGDHFEDTCTIAWPSAPEHSSQGTQIVTTCVDVDESEFQFVVIFIPDPDLKLSPSRSTLRIRGEVVDIADSEMGYKTLMVVADKATVR